MGRLLLIPGDEEDPLPEIDLCVIIYSHNKLWGPLPPAKLSFTKVNFPNLDTTLRAAPLISPNYN